MIYSKLSSNLFNRTSKSHLILNQRCIGIVNQNYFQTSSSNHKLDDETLIGRRKNKLNSVFLNHHRRFIYLNNNYQHNTNNLSKLPVIYREQAKCLSTQPNKLPNQLPEYDDVLKFKKVNIEGNLSLTQRSTPIELFLPSAYLPYIELMRLNKLTGNMFLIYPCLWAIAIGGEHGELPNLSLMSQFIVGAILMRSAGCIINDLMDKDFDKQVERTKSRPLASGKMSDLEAFAALSACLTASFHILLTFDCLTIMYGAASLLPVTLYPLMKRITNWPQLFLGLTFNWGAILGYSAIKNGVIDWNIVLPLYAAGICWTLIYDTIYAYQDYHFDKKLGLKSTTMIFGDNPKIWLNTFAIAMMSSFMLGGYLSNQMYPYYIGAAMSTAHALFIIRNLDPKNPENCFKQFKLSQFVGYYILMGIMLSVLFKGPMKSKKKNIDFDDIKLDDLNATI